jgi:hypothetical protein
LDPNDKPANMSLEEAVFFWATPLLLAWGAFVAAFSSALVVFVLVARARGVAAYGGGLGRDAWILWFFPIVAAMLLYVLSSIFRKTLRRKRQTGSLLPAGEELKAVRLRRRQRERIWVPAVCFLFSIAFTMGAIKAHFQTGAGTWTAWTLLITLWLISASITLAAIRRTEPRWLTAVLAALLGLAGICSIRLAIIAQHDRGSRALFSVLMWALAANSTRDLIRSFAKQKTHPDAAGNGSQQI